VAGQFDRAMPPLRVVKAAGAPPARRGWTRLGSFDSASVRIVASLLLVSIPTSILLGYLMSRWSTQTLIDQIQIRSEVAAESASDRTSLWVSKRRAELRRLAAHEVGHVDSPTAAAMVLGAATGHHPDFATVQVINPAGSIVATTQAGVQLGPGPPERLQVETLQPIQKGPSGVTWIMTAPILGPDERSQGVVVGDLHISALSALLADPAMQHPFGKSLEVHLADLSGFILYSSGWGLVADNNGIVTKGGLSLKENPAIIDLAIKHHDGTLQTTDYRNHEVLAGFELIPSLGWVVVASIDTAVALAPVYEQELRTSLLQVLMLLLLTGFAIVLAIFTMRPIVALSRAAASVETGDLSARVDLRGGGEVRRLGDTFNAMVERLSVVLFHLRGEVTESASKLSAASDQLAAATLEQTTAATATSASMEEVARTSAAIADTVDRVAIQAGEVQANLELAQTDLRASGDRTLALAGRVNEIEGILDLINDIADQTNLLALNAAIEAARAGDAGRGFAVVADEVRRLAERSKAAAGQIAKLVEGAQSQSSETVMALEKGVKQMERGLAMMRTMTEVSGQVQLASRQQRASTNEVVLAIEHIAEGSRAVAVTAQEIAAAAARQGSLAADLAGSGWEGDDREDGAWAEAIQRSAAPSP
jgi:methyl-accepting chemotaxis protein